MLHWKSGTGRHYLLSFKTNLESRHLTVLKCQPFNILLFRYLFRLAVAMVRFYCGAVELYSERFRQQALIPFARYNFSGIHIALA